jgi:hypothetical protein
VSPHPPPDPEDAARRFAEAASRARRGLLADAAAFLRENRKWWLAPILVVLALLGLLVLLAGSGAGPFVYPLF